MESKGPTVKWEGRAVVPTLYHHTTIEFTPCIKFISYNILADCKCGTIRHTTAKYWSNRKNTLIREIADYNSDIICLQDVDHFSDWWRPQLMLLGYDSIFKQRTRDSDNIFNEGVVIAYKRELFLLFKTKEINLNDSYKIDIDKLASIKQKLCTDDVGLISFLQPVSKEYGINCSLCIATCRFNDHETDPSIREIQCKYFTKCIEVENRDYHLPVLMGISLYDEPDSRAYHILRSGRDTLEPLPPREIPRPKISPHGPGSVVVTWLLPKQTEADPIILTFRVAWRPGGSKELDFRSFMDVNAGDCIQYVTHRDEKGIRKTVARPERRLVVSGLSAETAYEFKVLAINERGEGNWSEISEPILLKNPTKAEPLPPLKSLKSLETVKMLREFTAMTNNDWNVLVSNSGDVHPNTALTPRTIDGRVDWGIPRGRILPASTNPRQGWSKYLNGTASETLTKELMNPRRVSQSVIRDLDGFYDNVSGTKDGRKAVYHLKSQIRRPSSNNEHSLSNYDVGTQSISDSNEGNLQNTEAKYETNDASYEQNNSLVDDSGTHPDVSTKKSMDSFSLSASSSHQPTSVSRQSPVSPTHEERSVADEWSEDEADDDEDHSLGNPKSRKVSTEGDTAGENDTVLGEEGDLARAWDDDVLLDGNDVMRTIGLPNDRDVHSLELRSVYESYSTGSEPLYTISEPANYFNKGVRCVDYIFYSYITMRPVRILTIPSLVDLTGSDPRESIIQLDPHYLETPPVYSELFHGHSIYKNNSSLNLSSFPNGPNQSKDALRAALVTSMTKSELYWGGLWNPFTDFNPRRIHKWLPNDQFSSSHIALYAELTLVEENIPSKIFF